MEKPATITRKICCATTLRLVARNLYTPDPKIWRAWFYDFLLSKTNTTANLVERSGTAEDTTQLHNAAREHFKPRMTTKLLPISNVIYIVLLLATLLYAFLHCRQLSLVTSRRLT
jgi:hypothetical protein